MISKLQHKIMIVLVIVMCTFLTFILGSILFSFNESYKMRIEHQPGGPHPQGREEANFPSPVAFAILQEDGSAAIESNQIYRLTDEEILDILSTLKDGAEDSGDVDEGLRYYRHQGKNGTVYIFSDISFEKEMMRRQITNTLIIGGIAIIFFIIASYLLSRWLVQPVKAAWEKQKQFIADASHELKTPLTVILSNTDMIASSETIKDARTLQRLDNIQAESKRMRQLVESLLTLARSDNAPADPPSETVNLSYLITSAALTLEPSVYDAGHALITDIAPSLFMKGVPVEITQLLEILIDNACKYSTDGSDITICLKTGVKKESLLQVSSHGIPLSKEECVSIFERFYRTDASREVQQGYGLGLSIASEIVKKHGGSISASSDDINTNTITVVLPLSSSENNDDTTM